MYKRQGLKGDAGALAFRVGLLSDAYEKVAVAHKPQDSTEAFLIGVARGEAGVGTPPDQMGVAIADAFQPDARPGEASVSYTHLDVYKRQLLASGSYDPFARRYVLNVTQSRPTAFEDSLSQPSQPFHFPIAIGLLGPDADDLPFVFTGGSEHARTDPTTCLR